MNGLHHFGWVGHVVNAIEGGDEVERVVVWKWVGTSIVKMSVAEF